MYKAKNKTSVPNSDAKSQMRVIWGKVRMAIQIFLMRIFSIFCLGD